MTQEDRDMLIRIHENVLDLKKVVFGNGVPGLNTRVQALETSHSDCLKRQERPKQWPSIVAACCAIAAVLWGFIKG